MKLLRLCAAVYVLIIALSICYNTCTAFFPISMELGHDEAEHLHVAYLLSEGQKPFVDFIENHPTLFNHYLGWLRHVTGVTSTCDWAFYARTTIFAHFLICLVVFYCWTSNLVSHRPRGWARIGLLICAWSIIVGLYNWRPNFIWQIRPDWICYAYTLLGCYLFYLHFRHRSRTGNRNSYRSLASVLHPFHICCSSYLFCPTFEDLSSLYGFIFTQCLKTANMCTDRNRWICYYPHDVTASVFCSRISIEENRFQGCANVCPLRLLGG